MGRPAVARRAALALAAAAAVLLVGPVAAGPALDRSTGFVAVGHSQLVSSSPGAGDTVTTPPTEIRLVFSEPVEPRYTSLDLLDPHGKAILVGAGSPDPTDPRTLVASIPAGTTLTDGVYTVNWRALSAADGHSTDGFVTFGVGAAATGDHAGHDATSSSGGSGGLHSGHSGGAAIAEIQGKVLAYGGTMLAFGLAVLGWLVLRPAFGLVTRGTAWGIASGLLAAAAGCGLLLVLGASSLTVGADTDYVGFATGSRIGQLLLARLALGLVAGVAVLVLAWRGGTRGPAVALAIGGGAGAMLIVLTAASGHASAFTSPVPAILDVVHVGSGSIWLAGLVTLAALTDFGGSGRLEHGRLRAIVPRFSGLALVSVALIALTGTYADWVQTRDLLAFGTPYELNLLVKVLLFALAIAIGVLNYVDGGRDRRWLGGFSRRVLMELVLGVAVVVATANLTSGSPTALDRPVAISPAVSTAVSAEPVGLGLLPGRPGPQRFVATLPTPPVEGTTVALTLLRLDASQGGSRIVMRPDFQAAVPTFVADGVLPAGSGWNATVVATEPSGVELARQRFAFTLDSDGVAEGRATPPLDPGLVVAVLLLVLGLVGFGYALMGGTLPRTTADAGRPALTVASLVGVGLGVAILVIGGPT